MALQKRTARPFPPPTFNATRPIPTSSSTRYPFPMHLLAPLIRTHSFPAPFRTFFLLHRLSMRVASDGSFLPPTPPAAFLFWIPIFLFPSPTLTKPTQRSATDSPSCLPLDPARSPFVSRPPTKYSNCIPSLTPTSRYNWMLTCPASSFPASPVPLPNTSSAPESHWV